MALGRVIIRNAGWASLSALLVTATLYAPRTLIHGDAVQIGRPVDNASREVISPPRTLRLVETTPVRAIARASGLAIPGSTLTLQCEGVERPDAHIKWVQVEGPTVELDDATALSPRFVVPDGSGVLGFLLVVSDPSGSDTSRVSIPIVPRASTPLTSLRADAGDDQYGMVGRQVTLNGVRSEPRNTIGYRWIQVGGPAVRFQLSDGYIHSFVPPAPGVYRYALLVASASQISEPDTVSITVGSPAATAGPAWQGSPGEGIAELARTSIESVKVDPQVGESMASAFEDIAGRMDLYRSYDELYSELSRRLDVLLPEDPARRTLWAERIFQPMTARLIEELRAEGMDLRVPEGRSAGMTQGQRARFAEVFRAIAEGFRPAPTR